MFVASAVAYQAGAPAAFASPLVTHRLVGTTPEPAASTRPCATVNDPTAPGWALYFPLVVYLTVPASSLTSFRVVSLLGIVGVAIVQSAFPMCVPVSKNLAPPARSGNVAHLSGVAASAAPWFAPDAREMNSCPLVRFVIFRLRPPPVQVRLKVAPVPPPPV